MAKALGDNILNAEDGGVRLDADAKVDILAITISVAGVVNTEDSGSEGNNQSGSISFTGAGSVTVNIVETEARAEIGDGSTVNTSGDMSITADDNSILAPSSHFRTMLPSYDLGLVAPRSRTSTSRGNIAFTE